MKKSRKKLVLMGLMWCCILAGCSNDTDHEKDIAKEVITEDVSNNTTKSVNENESEITAEITSKEAETEKDIETTTEQAAETGRIEARLVNSHYAGDVLTSKDFYIKVINQDGSEKINPRGWSALPLELKEGENKITVSYGEYSTVITVNTEKKPEGLSGGEVRPPVIVNPDAFKVTGASVLEQTQDMGQGYLDKIIFLGDSRTYSYKAYGVLSGGKDTTQVWTPRNGTMALSAQGYAMIYYPETGTDISIRDAVAMKKPEYMVIGLGTNGVSYMSEDTFKAEYRSLITDIQKISPNTKIMINSIYPVANYYNRLDLINNEKIVAVNQWLVEVAEETGVRYLNTAEVLVDENGWLNMNYDNGGGATHLNRQGNEIVMQYIRTHGYK